MAVWHQAITWTNSDKYQLDNWEQTIYNIWKLASKTVFRPQSCVNSLWPSEATWPWRSWSTLIQVMSWRHQATAWTNVYLPSTRSSNIHSRVMFTWILNVSNYHQSPCCVWNSWIWHHSQLATSSRAQWVKDFTMGPSCDLPYQRSWPLEQGQPVQSKKHPDW